MKRTVTRWLPATAALSLLAALTAHVTAQAADIGSRELPRPKRVEDARKRADGAVLVPFFTWNGFYAGIHAGYGFGTSKWTDTVTGVSTGDFDIDGALVGGTAGYNMQLGGFILGIEGDAGASFIKGSTASSCVTTCETSSSWLATLRGRLGYALDRFLPYVTGGASFGDVEGKVAGGGSFSATNVGWNAGGGLEYAFLDNWTVKVEYLYVDLGTATCGAGCSTTNPFDVTFSTHVVRGGLNYKF